MQDITVYSGLDSISRERFAEIFGIIEQSFPPSERRSFEEHYAEFSDPHFRCMCCQPDRVVGFMNYWEFPELIYLEHFAVAEDLRGQGTGSALLEELIRVSDDRIIVLEAEPPSQSDTADHRIDFYRRSGFFVNEYEYFQPPMSDGEKPLRLLLLSYPAPLSRVGFEAVRRTLYTMAYKVEEEFMFLHSRGILPT